MSTKSWNVDRQNARLIVAEMVVHSDEWKCYYIVTKPSVSGVYNPQVAPFTNMV